MRTAVSLYSTRLVACAFKVAFVMGTAKKERRQKNRCKQRWEHVARLELELPVTSLKPKFHLTSLR